MSGKNTAKNTAPAKRRPTKNGGELKVGNPGNRGGTGRPPNEFKERMQALASQKNVEDYLRKCIRGEFGPKFFLQALQYTTDRGYGKAMQPVEQTDFNYDPEKFTVEGNRRVAAGEAPHIVAASGGLKTG